MAPMRFFLNLTTTCLHTSQKDHWTSSPATTSWCQKLFVEQAAKEHWHPPAPHGLSTASKFCGVDGCLPSSPRGHNSTKCSGKNAVVMSRISRSCGLLRRANGAIWNTLMSRRCTSSEPSPGIYIILYNIIFYIMAAVSDAVGKLYRRLFMPLHACICLFSPRLRVVGLTRIVTDSQVTNLVES